MFFMNLMRLLFILTVVRFKLINCNDLSSLIQGVKPWQEIKLDGEIIDTKSSDDVTIETDNDGKLSVKYKGNKSLFASRSTGLPSGDAQQLLDIVRDSLGSRYRLLATLKRGGRLLSRRDDRKLNEILKSNQQKTEVYINEKQINLSKASLIETSDDLSVLEPEGMPGVNITTYSDGGISVLTSKDDNEIKIEVSKGLNKRQITTLSNNFYKTVAKRASDVTGLPESLFEITLAGRDVMIERLSDILSPTERIVIGGHVINLDKSKMVESSSETTLEPEKFPQVKISWKKDGRLIVRSGSGENVYLEYSKGVEKRLISRYLDSFHRAVTLRLGTITWSYKLLGSVPPQLQSMVNELKSKIQERQILVNDTPFDLGKATLIKISDDSVIYRLMNGVELKLDTDGTVATENGEPFTVEVTPGISPLQFANIFSKVNQIFTTSIGYNTDESETLLDDASNRKTARTLLRGIKPTEKVTVDNNDVEFTTANISKAESNFTEYKMNDFDDVILTKFNKGDTRIVGKSRSLSMLRSSGITLNFLNRMVKATNNAMPRKRWFYNFGLKGYKNKDDLKSVIDELHQMIQKQKVLIDGKEIDFSKSTIASVDEDSTTYTPQTDSPVKITKFANGEVKVETTGSEEVTIQISPGITAQDSDNIIKNIKSIVGDRLKIETDRPDNSMCFSGDMRSLLKWLINLIYPQENVSLDKNDSDDEPTKIRTTDSRRGINSKNSLAISHDNGGGSRITSSTAGRLSVEVSTGLTEEKSHQLVDYLISLLEDRKEVIKMITGSQPEFKYQKIKELIRELIQEDNVIIDSDPMTPSSSVTVEKKTHYTVYSPGNKRDVSVKKNRNGSLEILSPNSHRISVSVGPGVTKHQAQQIYRNVFSAFKEKFSKITKIPVQFIDLISGLKKYFMEIYFNSAAPPKEFISVNGKDIVPNNLMGYWNESSMERNSSLVDSEQMNVTMNRRDDGTLEIILPGEGNIDVLKTTGLNEEMIDRLLRAVEFRLGLKNRPFRFEINELFAQPEKPESLDIVLKNFISSRRIFIDGNEVNMQRLHKIQNVESCFLMKSSENTNLIVKTCQNGEISVDYRGSGTLKLLILPGISQDQADFIKKSMIATIRTRSSNIKLLANFLDTFLQLVADGRIKSLDNLLLALIPREDIFVDGKRIKIKPQNNDIFNGTESNQNQLLEANVSPDVSIRRYRNGTIELTSLKSSEIDMDINSGISSEFLTNMIESVKDETTETLTPYISLAKEILNNTNPSTVIQIVEGFIKSYRSASSTLSAIDIKLVMTAVENEVKNIINNFNINEYISLNTVQKQQVVINNMVVNFDRASIIHKGDGYVTYSPENVDYVNIVKYDSGRIVVDSLRDEPVTVRVSSGIPEKVFNDIEENFRRFLKGVESVSKEDIINKVNAKLDHYMERLQSAASREISEHTDITIDDRKVELNNDSIVENTVLVKKYNIDNTIITLEKGGGVDIKSSASKLDFDISSGLTSQPVIEYLIIHSLTIFRDIIQNYENSGVMVPHTAEMVKIIEGSFQSLRQRIFISNNDKEINLDNMIINESTRGYRKLTSPLIPGLKVTSYDDGRITIDRPKQISSLKVYISQGLSLKDYNQFKKNLQTILSNLNPLELTADFFDILPNNFFILAQNMDRVLAVMNLIKI